MQETRNALQYAASGSGQQCAEGTQRQPRQTRNTPGQANLVGSRCACAVQAVRAVLGALPYANNAVYVHTDAALMPRRRKTWASWNCIQGAGADADEAVCVTYWLNNLQNLPARAPSQLSGLRS